MLRRIGLAMLVAALACPAAAVAGGYATLGLQSLPEKIAPGEPWKAEFTVLQHGRTPYLHGNPSVIVRQADGEIVGTFPGRLVNKDGLYRARVVFPDRGRYEYVIYDGFSQRHTFPPVTVGDGGGDPAPTPAPAEPPAPQPAASSSDGGGSSVPLSLVLAVGAGFLTAWVVMMLLSRRRASEGRPALGA
jgi:hypothetical protein